MIIREKYLTQVRPYYNKDLIKVITDFRRIGKSLLLQQIRDELAPPDDRVLIIFYGQAIGTPIQ